MTAPEESTSQTTSCSTELPAEDTVFTRYVLGLYSSAMIHLGRIPDPDTGEPNVNIPLARETMQYLEVLVKKTAGNLTDDEQQVLSDVQDRTSKMLVKACEMLGSRV